MRADWDKTEDELAQQRNEDERRLRAEIVRLRATIEQLRAALLWIDTFDPEMIAAVEEKFGLKLTK